MIKRFFIVYTIAWLIFLFFLAQSVKAEGNVGMTYSQIIDDRSFGATGEYTTPISNRVTFDAAATVNAGDIYNAKINTDFTFDIATVDLKLLVENKVKGYTLDTLGRENTLGVAFTTPIDDISFDVGIGGKNASPFGAPNAYDTLVAEGFNESDLANRGLKSVTPAATGLPFKEGNAVNAFVSTNFNTAGFDTDLKGIIELLGEGDKQHQVHLNFKRKGNIGSVTLTTRIEVGLMRYQDEIHYETALISSAGFDF